MIKMRKEKFMKREENNIDGFFKSEADKYVFILLHTDAANRMRLLGVTEAMYYNKASATRWYNNIKRILENGDCEQSEAAMEKLNYFYKSMTED